VWAQPAGDLAALALGYKYLPFSHPSLPLLPFLFLPRPPQEPKPSSEETPPEAGWELKNSQSSPKTHLRMGRPQAWNDHERTRTNNPVNKFFILISHLRVPFLLFFIGFVGFMLRLEEEACVY
jgi:hypothetical protein